MSSSNTQKLETIQEETSMLSSNPQNELIDVEYKQEQVTQFTEEEVPSTNIMESDRDDTYTSDMISNGELGDYLSRPVLISEHTWIEGTPFTTSTVTPWNAFFNSPAIKRKVDNYAFISCKLKVKIMVNSTPFLYGAMIAAYQPKQAMAGRSFSNTNDLDLTEISQAPHVWVLPQDSTGGVLELPFFHERDWLELTSSSELANMGQITLSEFVGLTAANGSASQSITVQMYAWAEDVCLSGPTYELAVQSKETYPDRGTFICFMMMLETLFNAFPILRQVHRKYVSFGDKASDLFEDIEVQAGVVSSVGNSLKTAAHEVGSAITNRDEYWKTPISSVSSSIAAVAKPLEDIPLISKFAKATQIGASAVSKVAKLFGFTNPPVIDNVMPLRNVPYHAFSSAEISVPADKFTLDPKNELSVDPRSVGLSAQDELAIGYIAGRESYIGNVVWPTTSAPGVDLFNLPVGPVNYNVAVASNGYQYALTPAALISRLFDSWRGDLILRFKVIASKYHCGRMRIVWDPKSDLNAVPDNTATSFNRVIDISSDKDVEIRIPYNQSRHFLRTPPLEIYRYLGVRGSIIGNYYDPEYFNGNVHGYVINSLSAPEPAASATVLIFARMADNFELANPINGFANEFSWFAPQSEETSISGTVPQVNENQYHTFFGESIRSIRTILRRTYQARPLASYGGTSATSDIQGSVFERTKYPAPNGYDPKSNTDARSALVPTTLKPYTYNINTPFSMVVPMYVGMRGSMLWHYEGLNYRDTSSRAAVSVMRSTGSPSVSGGRLVHATTVSAESAINLTTGVTDKFYMQLQTNVNNRYIAGQTVIAKNPLDGKSMCLPEMNNLRFKAANPKYWILGDGVGHNDSIVTTDVVSPSFSGLSTTGFQRNIIRRYFSIGPDFTVFFMLGVPRLYKYALVPALTASA